MDLIDLKGNTLKLYLVLATQRDQQDRCCLSRRALRRLTSLARDTIDHAVFQLQHHGLLVPHEGGWQIELSPLRQLVHGSWPIPASRETGPEIGPARVECGPKTGPAGQGSGPEIGPRAPSANAPTRTLWSSSSEEDVLEKPQYFPPPGGAGGDSIPSEFLVEMKSVWKAIAPQEREEPRDWFRSLHRDFGPQIPLTVLRQFAQSQRTLSHLRYPPSYKSYFTRCCHRAREEGTALPRPGRTAPAPSRALTAADYDLSDFYTPDPPAPWAEAN